MAAQDAERLVPLEEVQHLALSRARALPPVEIALDDALGCVLAHDAVATEDVPPFANTAMDGYAVRASDTANAPVELRVVDVLGAGSSPNVGVGPGEAVQIMTGAPTPPGADAIAIVERAEAVLTGGSAKPGPGSLVRILDSVVPGAHFRAAGSDLAAGSVAVAAGTVLEPAHIGVLASIGAGLVKVHPRPRVGVMSTGDELVELAADGSARPLSPGQIRDSNRHALLATLRRDGCVPVDLGLAIDTEEAVTAGLERALATCDAVITTGGVSKGEFDYVKTVLAKMGAATGEVRELSVAIRPAKPLVLGWLGNRDGAEPRLVPVFGLPGNPVSSLVSYEAIVLPVLRVLAGHAPAAPPTVPALADPGLRRRADGKTHLVRVELSWRADGRLAARAAGGQMSHQLSGMAVANGLAVVPDGEGIAEGEMLEVIPFGPIGPFGARGT